MENYTITKEQILETIRTGTDVTERYFKEIIPEAFKTEFKVGTVYKIDKNIFYCTEIDERGTLYGYGLFDAKWGERFNDGSHVCACNEVAAKDRLVEASTQEWEAALINEAKKRGFVEGAKFKDARYGKNPYKVTNESIFRLYDNEILCIEDYGNGTVFYKGNWAEILPQEKTVVPMEKALKIIKGEKYICRKDLVFCTGSIDFTRGNVYQSEKNGNLINNLDQSHNLSGNVAYKHFLHLPK